MSTSGFFFLEFEFNSLDLNYFGITNGGNIPCYLKTNFNTYSTKTNPPRCYGYASGVNSTNPLIIRVLNFAGFSANTNFVLTFDNFNNPPLNSQILMPIDMEVRLRDRTNNKVYLSYFPNIYYSDSVNVVTPTNLGGSIARTSASRGDSS